MDRDELEDMWKKCDRKNTRRIKPDEDFLITGLATYITTNPRGTKRWCASKNLKKATGTDQKLRKVPQRESKPDGKK